MFTVENMKTLFKQVYGSNTALKTIETRLCGGWCWGEIDMVILKIHEKVKLKQFRKKEAKSVEMANDTASPQSSRQKGTQRGGKTTSETEANMQRGLTKVNSS